MECPQRPGTMADLPFRPRRMVRWLSPSGLVSTGWQAALSGIVGRYVDRRELQAALAAPTVVDFSAHDDLWVDYVADTGDGFDPTYAIARLLADDPLPVEDGEATLQLPAAPLLAFGGDLVYPTASEIAYHDRLLGPLQAALPCTNGAARTLVAIPGNHDWYDGLTSFLRLFAQRQPIGGWQTRQTRSYFAVKLPHRWWLWGIDVQFDAAIDEPQLAYFAHVAEQLEPDDDVILCTAKPSWVREGLRGDDVYANPRSRRNVEDFERRVLTPKGISPVVTIAGHLHHYARYESTHAERRHHKITAGGGGAFLYPTHTLPGEVFWPRGDSAGEVVDDRYAYACAYPDATTSRRLRWRALWAPFANPSLLAVLGVVYVTLAWTMQFGIAQTSSTAVLADASPGQLIAGLLRNPVGLGLAVLVVMGLVGFAEAPNRPARVLLGGAHGLAHLAAALVATVAAGAVAGDAGPAAALAVLVAVVGVGGGLLGVLVVGVYLVGSHVLLHRHANEAFSAQHIADYKNVLRLHLDGDGVLTVYPIGLERVPRRWQARPQGPAHAPWLDPVDVPLEPHLIEPPIVVAPRRQRSTPGDPAGPHA